MTSQKISIDLGNVQKTMLLPLWGRAIESKKSNPLLVDTMATEIVDAIDFDFEPIGKQMHELTMAAWIIRSLRADTLIKNFISKYPDACIINIGCGLDTSFSRIDNGKIIWYNLDLPDAIDFRSKFIPASDRQKSIACSLFELDTWSKKIEKKENVFLLSMGVLYYFEENKIRDFFQKITGIFSRSEMFIDVSSPIGIRLANKTVIKKSGLDKNSFLKWGCKNPKIISSWNDSIKIIKSYPFFRGQKLNLQHPFGGVISDLLKVQYLLHLKIN